MGLNVNKPMAMEEVTNQEIIEVKEFDVEETRKETVLALRKSSEVQAIVSSINVFNMNSLLEFGNKAATELSRFSDGVLRTVEMTKSEDSSVLLNKLTTIMGKFDSKEITKEPTGLSKIFYNGKAALEKLLKKYHSMGDEIDVIQTELVRYQGEIARSNDQLEELFNQNLNYYYELEKYIVAGEFAVEELDNEIIPEYKRIYNQSGRKDDEVKLQKLIQAREALDKRVHDLRIAETVALQTLPSVNAIQYSNFNLMLKLNSSIIVGLPIFKNMILEAVYLKKQSLQTEALEAYDKAINKMLLDNSKNVALQTKRTTQLANKSIVEVETLEQAWNNIMNGINESKQLQKEASTKRIESTKKLQNLNQNMRLQW